MNMAEVSLHRQKQKYYRTSEHFGQNTAKQYFVTWSPYPKMFRAWKDLLYDLNTEQNMNGRDTQE